jgi:hypothetical protein
MKTYKVTVDDYGIRRWYNEHDQHHREDGPAVEWMNGDKYWYLNDKLHREGGPAVEWVNGDKRWFLNGKKLTEAKFNAHTKSCNGKVVEIDGKKYKLQAL